MRKFTHLCHFRSFWCATSDAGVDGGVARGAGASGVVELVAVVELSSTASKG